MSAAQNESFCTATLISSSCAVTAGHCVAVLERGSFRVPLSHHRSGEPLRSKPEDTYSVDRQSIQFESGGPGRDYAVFRFTENALTKKLPGDVYGYADIEFEKSDEAVPYKTVELVGYGKDYAPKKWNHVQQASLGKLVGLEGSRIYHRADTLSGNSGAPIFAKGTQRLIGIHAQGACHHDRFQANIGTSISRYEPFREAVYKCLQTENPAK